MHIISNAKSITAKIASQRVGFMTESIKQFATTLVTKIFPLGAGGAKSTKRRGESHVIRTWVGRLLTVLKVGAGVRKAAVARLVGLLVAGAGILGGEFIGGAAGWGILVVVISVYGCTTT